VLLALVVWSGVVDLDSRDRSAVVWCSCAGLAVMEAGVGANICLPRYGGHRCTNTTLVDMGPWMPWAKAGVQTPSARYRAGVLARAVGDAGTLGMTTSTVHARNTFRTPPRSEEVCRRRAPPSAIGNSMS
jgi:hypothetical protein